VPSPTSSGRPLRILTIAHNYPRFPGDPAGSFVARIAQGAGAAGHRVEVIAPHAPGTASEEQTDGVRLHRFRYAPELLERVAYSGGLHQRALLSPLPAVAFPAFLLSFAHAVHSAVRAFQPDLLHAHWWFPAGWFASRERVPYLITCHGSDVRLLDRGSLVRKAARRVFEGAGRVTTVSRFLAQDIDRLIPGLGRETLVTPMPLDVNRFMAAVSRKVQPPRVLYAGNLVPSKGVDVLLRAAAELTRRGVNYQLKVLGEGAARNRLEAVAHELGISSQVTWSGFISQDQMPAEYASSTVTVLPSRGQAEGLGLTLAEALLSGSAVVGSSAGGIPEVVIHERTGLIARDGDPYDLAEQIQRLLTDAELRERLTGAGKEHVLQTYAPEPAIGRFLDLYDAVAHHQSHG
jgi:glycosyltransferase involved in cell wall biosynthesis